jgi:hypothetical protein
MGPEGQQAIWALHKYRPPPCALAANSLPCMAKIKKNGKTQALPGPYRFFCLPGPLFPKRATRIYIKYFGVLSHGKI